MQDRNVSDAIYPPEDYRGYERQGEQGDYELPSTPEGPPKLYVDGLPIKEVAADYTILRTFPLRSPGSVAGTVFTPVEIVPRVPNNTRRRALIVSTSNQATLLDSPSEVVLIGLATTYLPTGFHLPADTLYEYTSAAALYAVGRGGLNAFSFVSVLIDMYETQLTQPLAKKFIP